LQNTQTFFFGLRRMFFAIVVLQFSKPRGCGDGRCTGQVCSV